MAPKKSIEKPKKKLSGYMLFSQERRSKLKSEKPNLTFGEVRESPPPRPTHVPDTLCSHPHSQAHVRLIDCVQLGKELGKEWRAMNDAQKSKYK